MTGSLLFVVAVCLGAEPVGVMHVPWQETQELPESDVSTAYSLDEMIVETLLKDGRVQVIGRNPGSAMVVVVRVNATQMYQVTVDAPPAPAIATGNQDTARTLLLRSFYDSQPERLTSTFDFYQATQLPWRLQIMSTLYTGAQPLDAERYSFPFMSLAIGRPHHRFTALDKYIEDTPLTLDGTTLRGAHYDSETLRLHAGFTSALLIDNVFISSQRETALGGAYRLSLGNFGIIPSFYYFVGDPTYGGSTGPMGSMMFYFGEGSDPLQVRGEVGYGNKLGAALKATYRKASHQGFLRALYQPLGFASIGIGETHGAVAEAMWSSRVADFLLTGDGYAANTELQRFSSNSRIGRVEGRYYFTENWSVDTGISYSRLSESLSNISIQSLILPLELAFDSAMGGVSARYRYQRDTSNNSGGSGGRVAGYLNLHGVTAQVFADGQRDTATTSLILNANPELAQYFAELNIPANSPDEIAAALANNPALLELGLVNGFHVNLTPWHLQIGASAMWQAQSAAQDKLTFNFLADRESTVTDDQAIVIGSLMYARHITSWLEGTASVARWSQSGGTGVHFGAWSFGVGLSMRIDDVNLIPAALMPADISGIVYQDTEVVGRVDASMPPATGVHVVLDGKEHKVTDADGRFTFTELDAGVHRIEVQQSAAGMYVTTRSPLAVNTGETATFGVATAPSHIFGYVRDDIGTPLAGVKIGLQGARNTLIASTDATGHYSFATGEGDYKLAVQSASLPAGAELADGQEQSLHVGAADPVQIDHALRIQRSLTGTVRADQPTRARVSLEPGGLLATPDAEGHFVLRHLKPGTYDLVTRVDDQVTRQKVTVPAEPGVVQHVDVEPQPDEVEMARKALRTLGPTPSFALGGVTLSSATKRLLDSVVEVYQQHPHVRLRIEGHTDTTGPKSYNLHLAKKRAGEAAKYLQRKGVPSEHMRVIGYGSLHPVSSNIKHAGRIRNRRVEFSAERFTP